MLHEAGHWLEDADPAVLRKAVDFLRRRTAGEEWEWLGDRYEKYEVAKRDKFMNAYIGKKYQKGSEFYATEVVSVGVEMLHADPLDMATHDPDFFDFIFNLLRGR